MAKKKKRKLKKSVKVLIILFVVVLIAGVIFIFKPFHKSEEVKKVKVEDSLEKYGYVLNENKTTYYKEQFKQ